MNEHTNVVGMVVVNDTHLRIVKGSISDHSAEVIVNSTDSTLSMAGKRYQNIIVLYIIGWLLFP